MVQGSALSHIPGKHALLGHLREPIACVEAFAHSYCAGVSGIADFDERFTGVHRMGTGFLVEG